MMLRGASLSGNDLVTSPGFGALQVDSESRLGMFGLKTLAAALLSEQIKR
jgi:hypothetical protein